MNVESTTDEAISDADFIKTYFPGFILVKTFFPGESFGEIALITSQGRTATLVARENSDLMVLKKDGFDKVMGQMKKNSIRDKIDFIRSFDFFCHLNVRRTLQVIQQAKVIKPELKEIIYEEGDNSNFIFLIKEGEIELKSKCPNAKQIASEFTSSVNEHPVDDNFELSQLLRKKPMIKTNKLITVKILGKGSYFGDEEIVKEKPHRQDRAVCHSQDAEIYAIEKNRLQIIMGTNVFSRLLKQVELKESLRSSRLKNAIKMQIPQSNISNLEGFLEKDRLNEQEVLSKQRMRNKLAQRLSSTFANRFSTEATTTTPITTSSASTAQSAQKNKHTINQSFELGERDLYEFQNQQNLLSYRASFRRISEQSNSLSHRNEHSKSTSTHTTQPNLHHPFHDQFLSSSKIPTLSISHKLVSQNQKLRGSLNKIQTTFETSLGEIDTIKSPTTKTIQTKSQTYFPDIEELNDESQNGTPHETQHYFADPNPQKRTSIQILPSDKNRQQQQSTQLKPKLFLNLQDSNLETQSQQQQQSQTERLPINRGRGSLDVFNSTYRASKAETSDDSLNYKLSVPEKSQSRSVLNDNIRLSLQHFGQVIQTSMTTSPRLANEPSLQCTSAVIMASVPVGKQRKFLPPSYTNIQTLQARTSARNSKIMTSSSIHFTKQPNSENNSLSENSSPVEIKILNKQNQSQQKNQILTTQNHSNNQPHIHLDNKPSIIRQQDRQFFSSCLAISNPLSNPKGVLLKDSNKQPLETHRIRGVLQVDEATFFNSNFQFLSPFKQDSTLAIGPSNLSIKPHSYYNFLTTNNQIKTNSQSPKNIITQTLASASQPALLLQKNSSPRLQINRNQLIKRNSEFRKEEGIQSIQQHQKHQKSLETKPDSFFQSSRQEQILSHQKPRFFLRNIEQVS